MSNDTSEYTGRNLLDVANEACDELRRLPTWMGGSGDGWFHIWITSTPEVRAFTNARLAGAYMRKNKLTGIVAKIKLDRGDSPCEFKEYIRGKLNGRGSLPADDLGNLGVNKPGSIRL